jgi:hypothetical protein
MASGNPQWNPSKILRRRLSRLLSKSTPPYAGLQHVAEAIGNRQWRAFVFGGVARDLLASRSFTAFRDVDLVIANVPTRDLASAFSGHIRRTTRFGGLNLFIAGWTFDIWPLEETWAFKQQPGWNSDTAHLPHTTFLNVEAVAIELLTERGRARAIYENNFFEGFRNRIVDINLEDNPYPQLCVVRSMIAAARLHFSISKRLAVYISHHSEGISPQDFEEVQKQHYGRPVIGREELIKWLDVVKLAACRNDCHRVELPVPVWRQLELWQHPG